MDVAYNQHANAARRKSRSSTNLNHLSLAPLTSKLPLQDQDDIDYFSEALHTPTHSTSYLQGKSAPTTPRLLSRSPGPSRRSRSQHRRVSSDLPKSKSATHLADPSSAKSHGRHSVSAATSPTAARRRHHHHHYHHGHHNSHSDRPSTLERQDSDWLLRAGALISTETRESKGQAWLISRASSTSLAGLHPEDDDFYESELAREKEIFQLAASRNASRSASKNASRRGSIVLHDDELFPSPPLSRRGSRSQSRVSLSLSQVTPSERRSMDGGYFTSPDGGDEDDYVSAGPDFVNLDERLEAVELDTSGDDEAHVRRLVKKGNAGVGAWVGSVLGVQLFSVEEDEEEEEDSSSDEGDVTEGETDEGVSLRDGDKRRLSSARRFDGVVADVEERMPSPKADEGGWHDAAWLLTVASKVLL